MNQDGKVVKSDGNNTLVQKSRQPGNLRHSNQLSFVMDTCKIILQRKKRQATQIRRGLCILKSKDSRKDLEVVLDKQDEHHFISQYKEING